jgi:aspartate/methionine/tyrosine aminotransferase
MTLEKVQTAEQQVRFGLRKEIVSQMEAGLQAGENPLFFLPPNFTRYEARCLEEGMEAKGVNVSLGDIDARSLAREPGFTGLASELGLNPDSQEYRQIQAQKDNLYRDLWVNSPKAPTGYQAAEGLPQVREAIAGYFNRWTGMEMKPNEAFVSVGGGSEAARVVLKGLSHLRRDNQQQPILLTSTPYYGPIIDMAREEGFKVAAIPCAEGDNFFFQPDQVAVAIQEYQATDIYLTTVGNPHGRMIPAEQLSQVLTAAVRVNPEIAIVTDTVYNANLGQERSAQQMAGFKDPELLDRAVFMHSLSKSHWDPADRFGFWLAHNQTIAGYIRRATTIGNPSPAIATQLGLFGVLSVVSDEAIEKGSAVLARRREAGLALLNSINETVGDGVFELPRVKPDGGLYLYPSLGKQMSTAFKVFEQTALFTAPAVSFGEANDSPRARLAFGRHDSLEILSMVEKLDLVK